MYIDNSEPSENVGQIHFSLEYDFQNTTLILKVIQVSINITSKILDLNSNSPFPGQRAPSKGFKRHIRSICSSDPPTRQEASLRDENQAPNIESTLERDILF